MLYESIFGQASQGRILDIVLINCWERVISVITTAENATFLAYPPLSSSQHKNKQTCPLHLFTCSRRKDSVGVKASSTTRTYFSLPWSSVTNIMIMTWDQNTATIRPKHHKIRPDARYKGERYQCC